QDAMRLLQFKIRSLMLAQLFIGLGLAFGIYYNHRAIVQTRFATELDQLDVATARAIPFDVDGNFQPIGMRERTFVEEQLEDNLGPHHAYHLELVSLKSSPDEKLLCRLQGVRCLLARRVATDDLVCSIAPHSLEYVDLSENRITSRS